MNPNTKGLLLGLIGYVCFSIHDVIIKYLGATYSSFQIVFFSVVFGFPLLSLMLISDSRAENLRPRHLWWVTLRTVSLLISVTCGFYALSVIPLAQTYAILFTMPLFVTLLAIPILGEKVGAHRFSAIIVGFLGVVIVLRPGSTGLSLGHLAAVIGAFGSALASVIVRRIGNEERDQVLLLYPLLVNFLVMGALMPLVYKPIPLLDMGAMALLAGLAFGAMLCMISAYKSAEAVIVAPMQYSQILWALLFGFLFFNEAPDIQTLVGASVIIASGVYIVYRESRRDVSANTPVLRTRSRLVAGIYIRIGPRMRAARWRPRNRNAS